MWYDLSDEDLNWNDPYDEKFQYMWVEENDSQIDLVIDVFLCGVQRRVYIYWI